MNQPEPAPSPREPAAERRPTGVVALLLVPLVGAVIIGGAFRELRRSGAGPEIPGYLAGLAFYLLWGAAALWYASRAGLAPRPLFAPPARRRDWGLVAVVLPLFPFTLSSLYLQVLAVSFVFPQRVGEWLAGPVPVAAAPPLAALVRTLSIAVIGPVVEEVVFRGVLLPLWSRRWGFRAGVIGTSALFSVLHANVVGSLVFGTVLAVLYLRTGSLLVPIAVHMLFNAPPALARLADTDPTAYTLAELRAEWMWPAAAFAATLVVLVVFVRRGVRGGHPRGPAFSRGG